MHLTVRVAFENLEKRSLYKQAWNSVVSKKPFRCSYILAVYNGHIPPLPHWPYVSDLGKFPPESCLFTFFFVCEAINLSLGAIFYFQ